MRQVLFDILAPRLTGARFLDLYAGFGAVGIEALSRGAGRAVLVERRRECCRLITENLQRVALPEGGEVVCEEVLRALFRLHGAGEEFEVIFADPPYQTGQAAACLGWLGERPDLLSEGGVVVVQHHVREQLDPIYGSLARFRHRRVGDTQLSFYARREGVGDDVQEREQGNFQQLGKKLEDSRGPGRSKEGQRQRRRPRRRSKS